MPCDRVTSVALDADNDEWLSGFAHSMRLSKSAAIRAIVNAAREKVPLTEQQIANAQQATSQRAVDFLSGVPTPASGIKGGAQ